MASTVSDSGPSVALTWIRARSSAVKWIRQTTIFSVTRHVVTNQCPVWRPFGREPRTSAVSRLLLESVRAR